jgi:antitoxin ParD1/3/4
MEDRVAVLDGRPEVVGEYQSASDYLRDLIRHDREETEWLLVEGLESGTARPLDMATLRKKLFKWSLFL